MHFLKGKTAKLIVVLRKSSPIHISELARKAGVSYLYTTRSIEAWEKAGLVKVEAKGKKKEVILTEEGSKIAELVNSLYSLEEKVKARE